VFARVPEELMDSFHWINVGVDTEPGSKLNPFTTVKKYDPDDLVVVKLDIDTPHLEYMLVHQLMGDQELLELVDVFYFEDHKLQQELMEYWMSSANGSIGESLELMGTLRVKGVSSHYWP
jgi:hypothetical protein